MEVKNYSVSKDTAALISCLEELSTVHSHIYEALAMHYDERAVESELGEAVFSKLCEVRNEVYKLIQAEMEENLCTTSTEKEI